ncbi:hypothetical protein B0H13DRAFT_1866999 [Mycena leptocephala]|nr:hypothetical protein B0H13DRAFT_1866999 [Mycena leptocephala]
MPTYEIAAATWCGKRPHVGSLERVQEDCDIVIQEQRENGIYCSRAYTGSVRQSGAQDRQKRADPARSKPKIKFGVTGGLVLFKLWLSVAKPISQAKTHSKCQNPDVRVADSDIISATVISNGLPREIAEFKGFGQTDT